jgi:hypothetical protein
VLSLGNGNTKVVQKTQKQPFSRSIVVGGISGKGQFDQIVGSGGRRLSQQIPLQIRAYSLHTLESFANNLDVVLGTRTGQR